MRSRVIDAPAGAGAEFGLRHGLVGIGEPLPEVPRSLAAAVSMTSSVRGERPGRLLAAFASVAQGTVVWTRDRDGTLRVGEISGGWRYADCPEAAAVGIHNVRPCRWSEDRLTERDAPEAVAATFRRGGRNFQRIRALG